MAAERLQYRLLKRYVFIFFSSASDDYNIKHTENHDPLFGIDYTIYTKITEDTQLLSLSRFVKSLLEVMLTDLSQIL